MKKIKITIYHLINKILFKLRLKRKGKHIFINIYNGEILTVHEFIRKSLYFMATALTEKEFWYGQWYFEQVLETLPDYTEDDFFTEDDSGEIFEFSVMFDFWQNSNTNGGSVRNLLSALQEYKLINNKIEEDVFMNRMKKWFPWQFGIHNWKTLENHK